jgi:hypothetical protein
LELVSSPAGSNISFSELNLYETSLVLLWNFFRFLNSLIFSGSGIRVNTICPDTLILLSQPNYL